ncbi:Lmo0850 family protein [Salinicoccus albus]|nr:Lmo0850 family protein [Salinicoccus albus]
MHKKDNSKVRQVVTMLNELGVKVQVSRSRFDMMNRIARKEKLRLKEQNT